MIGGFDVDPRVYYTQTIPAQWNRMLDEQAKLGAAGQRVYDEMRAVNESIHVELEGSVSEHFFLDIAAGRMTAGDDPAHEPFVTLILGPDAFRRLVSESGESFTALLGAIAGLAGDMKLTPRRVHELESVAGLIRFEVTGAAGFSLLTHFGMQPRPDEPDATIRMPEASYRALRAGSLDLQTAFLEDAIHAEGDLQKVMQLAFAAAAPD